MVNGDINLRRLVVWLVDYLYDITIIYISVGGAKPLLKKFLNFSVGKEGGEELRGLILVYGLCVVCVVCGLLCVFRCGVCLCILWCVYGFILVCG